MANNSNLRRGLSPSEARENGKKGGIASGKSRRRRKALRGRLEILLSAKHGEMTGDEAICMALIEKALTGDVRAFEVIRDTLGEKPTDKTQSEVDGVQKIVMCWGNADGTVTEPDSYCE